MLQPEVIHFYDDSSSTLTYIVRDSSSNCCAVIDSVLDFDYASGTIRFARADSLIDYLNINRLRVEWLLETHVHADHLSASSYLQAKVGGKIAIGSEITNIQARFGPIFQKNKVFAHHGSHFDVLLSDGDSIKIGNMLGYAMHTPGHTPACMSYVFGDAVFVGDTLFMPDSGTARCDFPGGDAHILFGSIKRILSLPSEMRIFVCHDYRPGGRSLAYQTTVAEERMCNIHLGNCITEEEFVKMREARDATLSMPRMFLPALQVNILGGRLPLTGSDGKLFLMVPINVFDGPKLTLILDRTK